MPSFVRFVDRFLAAHMFNSARQSLEISSLRSRYAQGDSPAAVLRDLMQRIDAYAGKGVWIHRLSVEEVSSQLAAAEERQRTSGPLPLFGIPFAIKDNIDLAGHPTSAGCPQFTYVAKKSAAVVEKLVAAGAIAIGKTNLDQFALGLVGTRSPFGACENSFDPRYISGGSSSGSAVAVAGGLVSFALATDTAGSGRVPAGFNNIVGLKPTRGRISAAGVVPACQSLDCVSVMALTCRDASEVATIAAGYDGLDPYSRRESEIPQSRYVPVSRARVGVPMGEQLKFFGNQAVESQYRRAIERLETMGATVVEIDIAPFCQTAKLLYEGPWVAERLTVTQRLLDDAPEALLPVTRSILNGARKWSAADAFEAAHALQALRRETAAAWEKIDLLLVPTAGTIYTIAEVEESPIQTNVDLGYYTNFVNLLDLCALGVPAGFGAQGLPVGVTMIAPAGQEQTLLEIGQKFHRDQKLALGATGMPSVADDAPLPTGGLGVRVAVVGAHLDGQPLNWQLTDRHARLICRARTAPRYQLFALPGTTPPKPGLVQSAGLGSAIELEVWEMSVEAFGSFVAAIPPPLGIGTITLEDGQLVKAFLCEEVAVRGARDISHFGGWRAFLAGT
jgi:allophanate hydrolase